MADERNAEIADLKARLARLEAGAPAGSPPPTAQAPAPAKTLTAAASFAAARRRAWTGVLIVGLVIVLGVIALSMNGGALPVPPPARPVADYRLCIVALVKAQSLTDQLDGAEVVVGVDPTVLDVGPPPRIQCGISAGPRDIGVITLDATCPEFMEDRCVSVVSAVIHGRVVLGPSPPPSRSRRHRH